MLALINVKSKAWRKMYDVIINQKVVLGMITLDKANSRSGGLSEMSILYNNERINSPRRYNNYKCVNT